MEYDAAAADDDDDEDDEHKASYMPGLGAGLAQAV
jgi:hypothetical protein